MKAIILAGGLGTRLKPFTEVIPKPLLPIGESSVLEIQILSLKKHGIEEIIIATNHMAEYVEAFLGNGDKYGVHLQFSKEREPLGTCGPVSLVREQLTEPFVLMNGDILTTLDFSKAAAFTQSIDANLVVMTKEIAVPFQFGKILSDQDYIIGVEEKPDLKLEILAGVYLLKPAVLELIPNGRYYGMDTLIKDMIARNLRIAKYPIREYWLDIGRMNDYEVAQEAYREHFAGLKKPVAP
jgi:NDP-sugar pyrophosphorylase family protein